MDMLTILLVFFLDTYVIFSIGNFYFHNIKKTEEEKQEEEKWNQRLKDIQENK